MRLYIKSLLIVVQACAWLFCNIAFAEVLGSDVKTVFHPNHNEFEKLTPVILQKMPIDHPLLRSASSVALLVHPEVPDWVPYVLKELKRRGGEATPLLLSLFQENPFHGVRAGVMDRIEWLPSSDAEALLHASRVLFKKDGLDLDTSTIYAMARMLATHGSGSDLEILKAMNYDPSTGKGGGYSMNYYIRTLTTRLANEAGAKKPTPQPAGPQILPGRRISPSGTDKGKPHSGTADKSSESKPSASIPVIAQQEPSGGNAYYWLGAAALSLGGLMAWMIHRMRQRKDKGK